MEKMEAIYVIDVEYKYAKYFLGVDQILVSVLAWYFVEY